MSSEIEPRLSGSATNPTAAAREGAALSTGTATATTRPVRSTLSELGIFLALLATWFALQAWVLPRFGIQT
jgi:hypothetical protein